MLRASCRLSGSPGDPRGGWAAEEHRATPRAQVEARLRSLGGEGGGPAGQGGRPRKVVRPVGRLAWTPLGAPLSASECRRSGGLLEAMWCLWQKGVSGGKAVAIESPDQLRRRVRRNTRVQGARRGWGVVRPFGEHPQLRGSLQGAAGVGGAVVVGEEAAGRRGICGAPGWGPALQAGHHGDHWVGPG